MKYKVFLVDDHPMIRERLVELINREPDLLVCGEAADACHAFEAILASRPDIAIVDLTLKGVPGIELIKDLRAHLEKLPILVLSMHDESIYAERVLRAGARGYITKQEPTRKVIEAIHQVLEGQLYVSDQIAAKFVRQFAGVKPETDRDFLGCLSDRELEIYQLIGQGHAMREIASLLHLDVKSVETYRARIKEKLKLDTATDLLQHATQWTLESGRRSRQHRPPS